MKNNTVEFRVNPVYSISSMVEYTGKPVLKQNNKVKQKDKTESFEYILKECKER